jgi:hypothetical protein
MNLQLITKEQHAKLFWQPTAGFPHAASSMLAGLVAEEMMVAQKSLVIAFMQHEDKYFPVALLGLTQGNNAYLNAQHQWQANTYIPAVFRSYPFHVVFNEEQQAMLCIDTKSGMINEQQGEQFFTEAGEATEKLQQILAILTRIEHNKQLTQTAMQALAQADVIEVWPLTIKTDTGEQKLEGLYKINEQRLMQLTGESLEKLMQTGAMMIAYAHFFSLQNLQGLVNLVQSQTTQQQSIPTTKTGDLDLEFLNQGGALNFSNFM